LSSASTSGKGAASASSTSASATSSGSGASCPIDCVDQNPCTDDACDDGQCVHTPRPVGDPGDASEGGCSGVCQTDGACGLELYSRAFPGAGAWSAPQALSTVWTGPNAPPPRGILATAHAYVGSRLLVWADDGMFYELRAGTWDPPIATATQWPGLGPTNLGAVEMWRPTVGSAHAVLAITTDTTPRRAFAYDFGNDDVVTPNDANPLVIQPTTDPQGAPQDTVSIDWSFALQTAYVGTASWVVFWRHFGSKVYEYDGGDGDWVANWQDQNSPIWAANGTAPAPQSVVAAYYFNGTLSMIAP
jgi:hypothetical protein